MAAPTKTTKDAILRAALGLVRSDGPEALNARALAKALGCSTQPIFRNYASMHALREDVIRAADAEYLGYLQREMAQEHERPYLASGLGYIRFAREQPNLFRLLFMRDRREEAPALRIEDEVYPALQATTGLSREAAERLHLHMWVYVHGVAVMVVTDFLPWEPEAIRQLLTEGFQGQLLRFQKEAKA